MQAYRMALNRDAWGTLTLRQYNGSLPLLKEGSNFSRRPGPCTETGHLD